MLVCCCIGVWRFRVVVDLRVVWWSQLLSVDIISPLWSTALKRSNPLTEPEEVPTHLTKPKVPAPLCNATTGVIVRRAFGVLLRRARPCQGLSSVMHKYQVEP